MSAVVDQARRSAAQIDAADIPSDAADRDLEEMLAAAERAGHAAGFAAGRRASQEASADTQNSLHQKVAAIVHHLEADLQRHGEAVAQALEDFVESVAVALLEPASQFQTVAMVSRLRSEVGRLAGTPAKLMISDANMEAILELAPELPAWLAERKIDVLSAAGQEGASLKVDTSCIAIEVSEVAGRILRSFQERSDASQ